jgi:MoxR-like ATPase
LDIEKLSLLYQNIKNELGKVIVGQNHIVDHLLISIFANGHTLLVGVPGVAKTLLVKSIATTLGCDFKRIQFTPDLMPGDILGSEVLEEDKTAGSKAFRFIKGPVFANIILADEINRTPPKTQAALLEAMQERQVTVAGNRFDLPRPFLSLRPRIPSSRRVRTRFPKLSSTALCATLRSNTRKKMKRLKLSTGRLCKNYRI